MSKGDDTKYKKEQKAAFNGIVKLASLLQKALETGRSSYVEMNEISRYMGYYVKTQTDDTSMYMDYLLNNYKNGMKIKRLRIAKRTLWRNTRLDDLARDACDLLFSPGGLYSGGFRPCVTMSRNMLPFERLERARYGLSPMGLRLLLLRHGQERSFHNATA